SEKPEKPEKKSPLLDVHRMQPEVAVSFLIEHAVDMGASDLFFLADEGHVTVKVRHLGLVREIAHIPNELSRRCLNHIRANAAMDLTERRRPLDGRWIYRKPDGQVIDLRISVIPSMYGEDFAMRLLVRSHALLALDRLGMTPAQLQAYHAMIASPAGLILITGPTGSGKTATLYSTLMRLNDGTKKINTIEDPIEYAIEGLRQSQVNPQIDLGFLELLRAVLRQSPDVIMIGEIRDQETARTAVHAANSGVVVFATLHAPSTSTAIQAMRSLGVHNHFLATSLRGIVSQRLVRTLDPATRIEYDLSEAPGTFDEVRPWLAPGEGQKLYAARPAESNQFTGYIGRTGVFEVMPITPPIRNLISDGAAARDIRAKAIEEKMLEFRLAALLKVAQGLTTMEEVFRVIPTEHLIEE
ncbi:MAG: GspE/PulE family protein, partial [Phycisphaerales bacterium]|nr:GspE/PulE family protein [Phycisphaerales bacterium]